MAKKAKKRTFSKAHRAKLSAAASARHAQRRKDAAAQKEGWSKSAMPKRKTGGHMSIAQIERSIKQAQRTIKKLRAHRSARLRLLQKLQVDLKALEK